MSRLEIYGFPTHFTTHWLTATSHCKLLGESTPAPSCCTTNLTTLWRLELGRTGFVSTARASLPRGRSRHGSSLKRKHRKLCAFLFLPRATVPGTFSVLPVFTSHTTMLSGRSLPALFGSGWILWAHSCPSLFAGWLRELKVFVGPFLSSRLFSDVSDSVCMVQPSSLHSVRLCETGMCKISAETVARGGVRHMNLLLYRETEAYETLLYCQYHWL